MSDRGLEPSVFLRFCLSLLAIEKSQIKCYEPTKYANDINNSVACLFAIILRNNRLNDVVEQNIVLIIYT